MVSLFVGVGLGALFMFMLMGKEARYFFGMKGNKKDISLIDMGPTGGLTLKKIRWNGDHFTHGKEAIYFPLDLLKNERGKEDKTTYNKVLQTPSYWSGCKVPALVAYNMVSFASNPHVLPLLTVAQQKEEPWSDIEKGLNRLVNSLKKHTDIEKISISLPVNIPSLHEYIDASTASYESHSFDAGLEAGKLLMTKPSGLPSIRKLILPIGIIVMLLILLGSGAFGDIGALFRAK